MLMRLLYWLEYGTPDSHPSLLLSLALANRDLVAAMAADFAPTLLKHLRNRIHSKSLVSGSPDLETGYLRKRCSVGTQRDCIRAM